MKMFVISLDHVSRFPVENYLQVLKKFVRNAQNPISQVVKRVAELENCGEKHSSKSLFTTISTRDKRLLAPTTYCRICLHKRVKRQRIIV